MRFHLPLCIITLLLSALAQTAQAVPAGIPQLAPESRISGGICVWLGTADRETVAQLALNAPFLIQRHLPQATEMMLHAEREFYRQQGLEGRVTVEAAGTGELPYADQLVSLLVLSDGASVPSETECLRVLRPFGEMLDLRGGKTKRIVKPRPAEMDDWTHWRHGAERNPVSHDNVVAMPERIQWLLPSPVMSERCHFVTANGRVFSQDKGALVARDACNGLPLWQAKLKVGKEFDWEYREKVSALIVAVGEQVYALLEDGKYAALDAATGKVNHLFAEANTPYDAVVIEASNGAAPTVVSLSEDAVRAFDASSGKLRWQEPTQLAGTLIASAETVFYIEGNDKKGATEGKISARELATGKLRWTQTYEWARRTEQGALGNDRIVYEMRFPIDWKERYANNQKLKDEERYALVVIDAKTGKLIEKVYGTSTSARHGEFRAAFWHGENLVTEAILKNGINVVQFGLDDYKKPFRSFRTNEVGDRGFGHCYPPVLTDRYYLNGQLNFVDLATGSPMANPITRGGCNTARSGYVPANGLIYTFPKHCVCYPMLDGSVALAARGTTPPKEDHPLIKGAAWPASTGIATSDADWPTFRHDASRTSGTTVEVAANLQPKWSAEIAPAAKKQAFTAEWSANPYLAGPLTAPVVAEGCVFVGVSDSHRLVALEAATGAVKWEFATGGRIDTPPTIHHGSCLLGSRDGWIYNIRVKDGALIYKLRAAPWDRRIAVHGQVESACPVVGSILVTDGIAVAVAGIHPNSDGGVRVIAFTPESGEILWQSKFDDLGFNSPWPAPYDPRTTRPESDPWRTIHALEYPYFGLPVRDGAGVAVSRCVFDLKTGKADLRKTKGFYHISATDVWLPRTAWHYATERAGDPQAVSLGASVFGTRPATSKLFRVDFKPGQPFNDDWVHADAPKQEIAKEAFSINRIHDLGPQWETASRDSRREFNRAMLVAGSHLFTITPRGLLTIHRTTDGTLLKEMKLDPAVWNGLAAAQGHLFLSTMTGKVVCFAEGK